ncbi:MAG TPA: carboxypeptidase regulatory-like domain-containing protein [Iamia sp.]
MDRTIDHGAPRRRARAAGAALLGLASVLVGGLVPGQAASALIDDAAEFSGLACTTSSTTNSSSWGSATAPTGAVQAVFTLTGGGGAGGDADGADGGAGGRGGIVTGTIAVTPGQRLWAKVGCGGTDADSHADWSGRRAAGYNRGGGAEDFGGGGGGGSTGLCLGTATASCGSGTMVAIAGGGGGGGNAGNGTGGDNSGGAGGTANVGSTVAGQQGGTGRGGGRGSNGAGSSNGYGGGGGGGGGQGPGQDTGATTANNTGGTAGNRRGSGQTNGGNATSTPPAGDPGEQGAGGRGSNGDNDVTGGGGGGGFTGGGGGGGGRQGITVWDGGAGGGAGSSWVSNAVTSAGLTGAATGTANCSGAALGTSPGFGASTNNGNRGCHGYVTVTWKVNRTPTATAVAAPGQTVNKGAGTSIVLGASDLDSDTPLTCAITTAPSKGTLSGGTGCTRTYTPNPDTVGPDSFAYTVTDTWDATSAPATVNLTIANRNPSSAAKSVTVVAGAPTPIALDASDLDGDTLTCTPSDPSKGTLSMTDCSAIYTSDTGTANAGVGGSDSFTYTVADQNSGVSPAATVTVTIASPDLSLTKSHTGRFNEGTGTGTYTLTVANSATAPANGTTTLVDTLPAGMVFRSANVGSSGFSCSATPGVSTTVTCTRSSAIPVSTSVSLTITVDVAAGAASPVSNTAEVSSLYELASTAGNNTATDPTDVNHRPTGAPQTVSTGVDVGVDVTFAGNDPDGDALTFQVATEPGHGDVDITGGVGRYTPDAGFQGVDTFTYTATDTGTPGLVSVAQTITVYVGVSELVGTVTDEVSGAPVAGVEARLVNMADPEAEVLAATVLTDGAGAYDFGAVPFGTYGIRFVDPSNDHIAEWFDDAPTSATANLVTLDASAASVTRSVALRPGARVAGTVRSSAVPNPTVEGLQVRLVKIGSPGSSARSTNSGGQYAFELLQPGTYQLWFRDVSSGQWVSEWYSNSATQGGSATIELGFGQEVDVDELVDPVAPPPPPDSGSVGGTVTDTNGTPLAGVQVRLYVDPYTKSSSTTTDVNGQYSFTRLAPGTYKLWFRDMTGTRISEYGGDASTLAEADALGVANDGHIVDAELAPKVTTPPPPANSGVVSGTVTEIDGFTPIAGINVRLYPVGGTTSKSKTTDANGGYAFTGLAPGQYQLVFRDTTGTWFNEWHLNAATEATSTAVTVTNGQTTDVDATLNRR